MQTPAVRFAQAHGLYRPGSGVMVWAHTVDDAYEAVRGNGSELRHPVTVYPLTEAIRALTEAPA